MNKLAENRIELDDLNSRIERLEKLFTKLQNEIESLLDVEIEDNLDDLDFDDNHGNE